MTEMLSSRLTLRFPRGQRHRPDRGEVFGIPELCNFPLKGLTVVIVIPLLFLKKDTAPTLLTGDLQIGKFAEMQETCRWPGAGNSGQSTACLLARHAS